VEVFLPVGSSLEQTSIVMKEIEDKLKKDSRVKEVAAFVEPVHQDSILCTRQISGKALWAIAGNYQIE
jgi:multidrug efflux pump subunit AcrB